MTKITIHFIVWKVTVNKWKRHKWWKEGRAHEKENVVCAVYHDKCPADNCLWREKRTWRRKKRNSCADRNSYADRNSCADRNSYADRNSRADRNRIWSGLPGQGKSETWFIYCVLSGRMEVRQRKNAGRWWLLLRQIFWRRNSRWFREQHLYRSNKRRCI